MAHEAGGRLFRELQSFPARVTNSGSANPANAVNAAFDLRLRDARNRAAMNEPGPGVHYEETSVGVLYDVGRVEIGIDRSEKIFVDCAERGSLARQNVALHAVRVELRAEKITLILRAKARAAVPNQTGRSNARELGHDGHQFTRALELTHDRVPLRIDAAPDPVHQGVALAITRILEICHSADGFAGRKEDQLDWIIESAAGYPF